MVPAGLILTSLMAPLLPSTTYYYQIAGQAHPNSFITAPAADLQPFTFALIGDLGKTLRPLSAAPVLC